MVGRNVVAQALQIQVVDGISMGIYSRWGGRDHWLARDD